MPCPLPPCSARALAPIYGVGVDTEVAAGGRESRPPWGLAQALGGLVVAFVLPVFTLGAYAAFAHPGSAGRFALSTPVLLIDLASVWAGLAGAVLLSARAARSRLSREFGFRVRLWPDVPLGIGLGVVMQFWVLGLLYAPLRPLIPHLNRKLSAPALQLASGAHGNWQMVVTLVVLAIGAPVVEELFFRGLLLRSLQRRFGSSRAGTAAAVLVSALVFGLAHAEALQTLGLVVFGIVLAVLAVVTKRLGPGIFAHGAFNAAASVVIFAHVVAAHH